MGQKPRGLAVRTPRWLRTLYPGVRARGTRPHPLARLSVLYVLGIIAAGWYITMPMTLLRKDWHPWEPKHLALMVFFNTAISLTTIAFLLTCYVDAGPVPEEWRALATAGSSDGAGGPAPPPVPPPEVLAALPPGEAPRFCRQCRVFKPPRAHHCSSCDRCTLLMDHHCPLCNGNCIGFANRKFFILFLLYASLSCWLVTLLAPLGVLGFLEDIESSNELRDILSLIFTLVAYLLCFLHAIVLAGFGGFHIFLVLRNSTTIEHADHPAEDSRQFNRGAARNWRAVFGTRPELWFLPVSLGCEGDGLRWRDVGDEL